MAAIIPRDAKIMLPIMIPFSLLINIMKSIKLQSRNEIDWDLNRVTMIRLPSSPQL
jgi:hypothetical protein